MTGTLRQVGQFGWQKRFADRLPHEWLEALDDLWWAEQFRWPPQTVDEMPLWRSERLQHTKNSVEQGRDKARQEQEKKNSRG